MKNQHIHRRIFWVVYPVLFLFFMIYCFFTCNNNPKSAKTQNQAQPEKKREFVMVIIPSNLTLPADRAEYLVTHYWDNFHFSDTAYIHLPDITEAAYVYNIEILPHTQTNIAESPIKEMLAKSQTEKGGKMYSHFLGLYNKYLYDPNSPMRNEEFYIPVTEFILADGISDEAKKERAKFDLDMMMKNRIGNLATDFTYILQSGKTGTLYNVKANNLILMFYNPDCHACDELLSQMKASPIISKGLQSKLLNILAVYPDKDLDIWKKHLKDIPVSWINGYDRNETIQNEKLYDLKAIPCLYLLDKDKKVILKDAPIQAIEAYIKENNPILFTE